MFITRENASIPKLREAKVWIFLAKAKKSIQRGECEKCDKCGSGDDFDQRGTRKTLFARLPGSKLFSIRSVSSF
jgi:hypothetical protein